MDDATGKRVVAFGQSFWNTLNVIFQQQSNAMIISATFFTPRHISLCDINHCLLQSEWDNWKRISQPGKYAGIAGMIDILQGLGVRSWFQLSFTLLMVIPSLKLRLFSPCYFCWQSYDVQAFGSWSPHSFHAHWAGAQLQELTPRTVEEKSYTKNNPYNRDISTNTCDWIYVS